MRTLAALGFVLALIAGCTSEAPKEQPGTAAPAKPAAKPPEYDTGRVALQRLYVTARQWAPDVQPFRLESQYVQGAPVTEGKAGVWRGSFASVSRRAAKPYLWSGVTAEDAPERGITPGVEDDFNPQNQSTRPFDIAFLKVDTDKAFTVAQEHGGAAILKKAPDQPVSFVLDWDARKNQLVWHVIYGISRADARLTVAVDASTGEFLRVEK
ncbi:MAG TPA: hypothetical protein VNK82_04175 [Terriglobales bacterium]|nr:hypothetical protein [Terriglobales bacterium]